MKDEEGKPFFISPADVEARLKDPEFQWYLNLWNITALLDEPPFSGGWSQWPTDILDAFVAFAGEQNRLEHERMNPKKQADEKGLPHRNKGVKGGRNGDSED